ncbi:TPA: hypothetical protein ACHXAH_004942, partial [Escherichia coli]
IVPKNDFLAVSYTIGNFIDFTALTRHGEISHMRMNDSRMCVEDIWWAFFRDNTRLKNQSSGDCNVVSIRKAGMVDAGYIKT